MDAVREARVGRFRIRALRDASFALDGGAMFGVVPRTVWEKLTPVHADHTVPLSTTPYLVEDGEHVVVVEAGIGRRWDAKAQARFHFDWSGGRDLAESLERLGVAPTEVTHCLLTHCHWDHIGAACDAGGRPLFPNAVHWTPEVEREAAYHPGHVRRGSYRAEDLRPLDEAGLLHTFQGECRPLPGVRMVELGGHSDGVSVVLVEDAGETACFWADVVPTANHVHPPFIMAYDMNAAKSFEVRSEWIARAEEQGWIALLYHDPATPMGRFVREGKRYAFEALAASGSAG